MEGNGGSAVGVYITPWVVFCLISSDIAFMYPWGSEFLKAVFCFKCQF